MVALIGLDVMLREDHGMGPTSKPLFVAAFQPIQAAGVSSTRYRRRVLHHMYVAIRTAIPSNVIVEYDERDAGNLKSKHALWLRLCYCAAFNTPVRLDNDVTMKLVQSLPLYGVVHDTGVETHITLQVPGVALRYISAHYPTPDGQFLGVLTSLPAAIDIDAPGVFEKLSRLKFLAPTVLHHHGIR